MKRVATYIIYMRNISLLLCSGLILTLNSNAPILKDSIKKIKQQEKLKLLKAPAKQKPVPFSFYNDVITPIFPALKI
jgi:hypothetical protein